MIHNRLLKILSHRTFLLYVLTGASVTLLELLALRHLVYSVHMPYLAASCWTFALGLIVSFFLRKYFVFENHDWPDILKQFGLYSFILVINTGLNALVMYYLVDLIGGHIIMSQVISNLFLGIISYLFNKAFTFRKIGEASLNLPEKIANIKKEIAS